MQDVEDEPLFCERVAGLDIAKAGVEVAIRVPGDTTAGRRQQETRSFGTTRAELESLGDWLACWGVTRAGMEATSVIRGPNVNELDIARVVPSRTRL
jgi:transposase